MFTQQLFTQNAGLIQGQQVKACSSSSLNQAKAPKKMQPGNIVQVTNMQNGDQSIKQGNFVVGNQNANTTKQMTIHQNRYKPGSQSQPIQNQFKSQKFGILKMMPSARNVVMNPVLALQRRVPQPAMIAKAAQFTVQQQGKIEVKSNHMDSELTTSIAKTPKSSLLRRAVAPVMQYGMSMYGGGYGMDMYGGGYGMGYGGYGGMGYGGMGYGGMGMGGMGYGGYGMGGGYGGYGGYGGQGRYGRYGRNMYGRGYGGGYGGGYGMSYGGGYDQGMMYGPMRGGYGYGGYGGYGMGGYGGGMGGYGMGYGY